MGRKKEKKISNRNNRKLDSSLEFLKERMVNSLMSDGKKSTARASLQRALDCDNNEGRIFKLKEALAPLKKIKPYVLSGEKKSIPIEPTDKDNEIGFLKIFKNAVRHLIKKDGINTTDAIKKIFTDTLDHKNGNAIDQKKEQDKIAEKNRAYASYISRFK